MSIRIKEKLEPKFVIVITLCFLLIFQNVNPIIPVNAQPAKSLVVEGKHIRFFLQEETSNLVPITSINSRWLALDVKMDGRVSKGEWSDAEALIILPGIFPRLHQEFNGTIYIKNNEESLFIGIDALADTTQDAKDDWVEVSFVNYGPGKQNFTSVVYHVEAAEKSTLVNYSVIKDGKNTLASNIARNIKSVRSEGGTFFENNRMYELKVSLTDPSLKIHSDGILHLKLLINDGSSGKKCQYCAWEIGLASSKDKPGSAMNFRQMIEQKVVPLLDGAYENFLILTKSAPYNGDTIDIKISDSKTSGFGNPIIVNARTFLPYLASNDLPDTYLYPFVHQLAHNFVPLRSPLSLGKPISSAFADLMTYEFFKQMKIPYNDRYGSNILKKYENDKSPFAKLTWSDHHPSKAQYPTDALMYGIFKKILSKYGWKLFAEVARTELDSAPQDIQTKISLLIHMLSKSARKDLTPDFKDTWNFPITSSTFLFDFDLQNIDNIEIVQGGSVSKQINVSLIKWLPQTISLSVNGLPKGAKATFDPAKGDPPFQSKLNVTTSLNTMVGSYPITIVAFGADKNHTLSFKLNVIPITDLIKMDLKSDKILASFGGQFKFSTSIKSNQTSSMINKLGLFIDNKFVTAQNFTLDSKSKSLDFIWNSKGIDANVLHTAQVKIMSGDKAIEESNKLKFGVFEAVKKAASQSKNIVITEPIAKDPDTKKNYTLANIESIKVLLKAKGNYDLKLIAPDGTLIIGKGGLIDSPGRIKIEFDLKNVKIKVMYTGSKASNEMFIVEPVQVNKPLPSGPWKVIIEGNGKESFSLIYIVKYVPSPELSKGFKT